jgi:SAM-dependent methyltransferase
MEPVAVREVDKQVAGLETYVAKGDFSRYYGTQYGDPFDSGWPWGTPIMQKFLLPFLGEDKVVMEIGAGGGRWSQFIIPQSKQALIVDGTKACETAIRGHFGPKLDLGNVQFLVSPDGKLPKVKKDSVDFVFSFDTFVHFDEDLFCEYMRTVARVLKPGGVLSLYYAFDASYKLPFFRYYDNDVVKAKLADLGLLRFGEPLVIRDSNMWLFRKV